MKIEDWSKDGQDELGSLAYDAQMRDATLDPKSKEDRTARLLCRLIEILDREANGIPHREYADDYDPRGGYGG